MFKIYKIIDNTDQKSYIGITKRKLQTRLNEHKSKKDCSAYEIIKKNNYKIELIEETEDKFRERYWIEKTDCVNKIKKSCRTDYEKKYNYKLYNKDLKKVKKYTEKKYNYIKSWGGDSRWNNNLLKIDMNLFC